MNQAIDVEHLFGDLRPFAQCHASTLVAGPNGGHLVAWFGGTHEGHPDVAIWAAQRAPSAAVGDNASRPDRGPGEAWSKPRLIAKIREEAHWNPVLFALDAQGLELVLHFKVGPHIRSWQTWAQRSHDGGETWETASPLVPGDRGGRGAVRNKPIQTRSGAWLAGASVESWRRWEAFIDRSENGLDDWVAGRGIEVDRRDFSGKGLIQPALWQADDDSIHAVFRSTDGRVHRSESRDDGRTWSIARAIDVPNNNSGLDLARLPDGTLALACNPVAGNWAARTPLSVLFSRDEGRTWPARIDVETGPGEFSYPALIAVAGDLALTWTWNRRRIAFAEISAPTVEQAFQRAEAGA